MKPESWTAEGNGVLFLVGVSDGKRFDELFRQHVNPFGNPGDRKWIPSGSTSRLTQVKRSS